MDFGQTKLILRHVLKPKKFATIFKCQSLLLGTNLPNDSSAEQTRPISN